ncbi:hypothetical protein XELAEV_18043678mg [Xenopus laevis]|uniref:Uncharacterized protein n=1 Tax=Xenopus laevis TaxID=8355 RepID=A0A974BX44_XENLA|nr:hypothetical protein XELAEV_18043678mg [Xenopus laevis]
MREQSKPSYFSKSYSEVGRLVEMGLLDEAPLRLSDRREHWRRLEYLCYTRIAKDVSRGCLTQLEHMDIPD